MSSRSEYDRAVSTLYQAAHESFVTERTRLAAELKASGDKPAAAKLAKLGRPTISAWAVNQLWWHSRAAFDELFASAKQLRAGQHSASAAHRQTLQQLTTAAHRALATAGHSANDATLRRVTMTLTGLAATGSFEPDPDGALTKDRDPPGFEAFGVAGLPDPADSHDEEPAPKSEREPKANAKHDDAAKHRQEAEAQQAEKEREAAEKKHAAEARAKRLAQQRAAEAAVREATGELREAEHEHERAAKALASAESALEKAQRNVERAKLALAELSED